MAIKNHSDQNVTPNQMAKLLLADFITNAMEFGMERFNDKFDNEAVGKNEYGTDKYRYKIATEKELNAIREQIQKRGNALLNYLGNPDPFKK